MINILLRILTFLLFVIRNIYWWIRGPKAYKHIPLKNKQKTMKRFMSALIMPLLELFVFVQLIGYRIYPFPSSLLTVFIGFAITAVGLYVCITARKTLGDSWTNAYEYEARPLVTSGIYRIVRHPIYLGLTLMLIGGELVAGSWLFIAFFAFFIAFYFQGRREEKILLAHFGKEYNNYMSRTKMLIPYVL